jgi:hypothetical protein
MTLIWLIASWPLMGFFATIVWLQQSLPMFLGSVVVTFLSKQVRTSRIFLGIGIFCLLIGYLLIPPVMILSYIFNPQPQAITNPAEVMINPNLSIFSNAWSIIVYFGSAYFVVTQFWKLKGDYLLAALASLALTFASLIFLPK